MKRSGGFALWRRRRVIAAIICCAVALSMLFSSAYLAHEAAYHHDCTGEHCPVCRFIAQIEQVWRSFGMALLALLVIRIAFAAGRAVGTTATMGEPALCTLVGRKIRLND